MNILGLATSLTAVLIISLYITSELSADGQHTKADQIYRVGFHQLQPRSFRTALSAAPVGPSMTADYPEILDYVRLMNPSAMRGDFLISFEDQSAFESGLIFADTNFFEFFDYAFIYGNKETALSHPNSIVLTEEKARLFFGETNPIGKVIRVNDQIPMVVSSVIKSSIRPTHLRFHYLIPFQALNEILPSVYATIDWYTQMNFYTYLLVDKDFDPIDFEERNLEDYVMRYLVAGRTVESPLERLRFDFTPLRDIYFDNEVFAEIANPDRYPHKGNKRYMVIFGILAAFLSIIAVINYTNMSIARSMKRSKEVGIRKVLGSNQKKLIMQYIGEASIFIIVSLLLSLIIAELFLPGFNNLMNKNLSLSTLFSPVNLIAILGFSVFLSLISGSYPAFYMSRIQAIQAIKGEFKMKGKTVNVKNLLFAFQFFVSVFIIICTLVVYQQFRFMEKKDMGFATENRLSFTLPNIEHITPQWIATFKSELLQHANIQAVSSSRLNPLPGNMIETWTLPLETAYGTEERILRAAFIDPDFIDLFEIEILEGRAISWEYPTDLQGGVLLNETAVREFGWENPVGKTIRRYENTYRILGVVSDFHFFSLHQPIEPMILLGSRPGREISVKLDQHDIASGLQRIQQTWTKFLPAYPFAYTFTDDQLAGTLDEERKTAGLLGVLAIFAIFISLAGLFGLSAFSVEQRTREIAIRRTYGASLMNIILLLSKQFGKLLGIALLLSVPASYGYTVRWLENFSYRIDLSPWPFIAGISSAIIIIFMTLWYHANKSTGANPVDALRHE